MRLPKGLFYTTIDNELAFETYLIARIARNRQEADGLSKSSWILFHAAALKPFCGVEVVVPELWPLNVKFKKMR